MTASNRELFDFATDIVRDSLLRTPGKLDASAERVRWRGDATKPGETEVLFRLAITATYAVNAQPRHPDTRPLVLHFTVTDPEGDAETAGLRWVDTNDQPDPTADYVLGCLKGYVSASDLPMEHAA